MRNALLAMVAALPLAGCVYYDCAGESCGHWDWEDDWCEDGSECDEPSDCDDTGEPEDPWLDPYGLYLTPEQAEQGSAFIASIRSAEELDLVAVTAVELDGDVAVGAVDARHAEVLVYLEVAPDAVVGPVDVYVTLGGDETVRLDEPLVVFEAGSGHEPGTSDDGSGC